MDGDKIEISRSSIGMFNNRSKIKGIKSISSNINALVDTGHEEVARAIENITTAIVESDDLFEEQQNDMLELIEEISQQATLPDERRSSRGVIRGLLAGLATGIGAAGGLAEVWSTWGPTLIGFFN